MLSADSKPDYVTALGVGALVLGACIAGYVYALGQMTPQNLFGVPIAMKVFEAHSVLSGIAISIAILAVTECALTATSFLERIAARVLVAATVVLSLFRVVAPSEGDDGFAAIIGALQTLAGVLVIARVIRRARASGWTPSALGIGIAGVGALIAGARMIGLGASLSGAAFELVVIASVAILAEPPPDAPRGRMLPFAVLAIAIVFNAIVPSIVIDEYTHMVQSSLFFVVVLFAWGAIVMRVWRGSAKTFTGHATMCARLAAALFAGVMLGAFVSTLSVDIHLHDTTFTIGVLHMNVFVVMLTWLTLWLRDREPRPGARAALTVGVVLLGIGAHMMCWSMIVMGSQGMPLRYVGYLDQFERLHRAVAFGATLFMVGLVTVLGTAQRRQIHDPRSIVDVFA
jgi:hypothetical protein